MIKIVKPLVLPRFKGDPPSVTCGGNKTTTLVPATTTPIPMPATSTESQNGMLIIQFDLFLLPMKFNRVIVCQYIYSSLNFKW